MDQNSNRKYGSINFRLIRGGDCSGTTDHQSGKKNRDSTDGAERNYNPDIISPKKLAQTSFYFPTRPISSIIGVAVAATPALTMVK